jgi:phosphate transport system permease protein
LATGRALGETVAVALVIGNSTHLATSLKANAATIPSLIVSTFGEATGTELNVLFTSALVLLVVGIGVNALARVFVRSVKRSGAESVAVA